MHEHDRDQPVDAGGLYMDRVPRASLEDEVVEGLRGRGALGRPNARRSWGLQAAAAGVLFLSGWGSAVTDCDGISNGAPLHGGSFR